MVTSDDDNERLIPYSGKIMGGVVHKLSILRIDQKERVDIMGQFIDDFYQEG